MPIQKIFASFHIVFHIYVNVLFLPLYKTVGIALVVRVGGNLCRDAGERALSSVVETAGSLCALVAAAPLMQGVLSLILELMQ